MTDLEEAAIELVEWTEPAAHSAWTHVELAGTLEPVKCLGVGIVISETPESLVIATRVLLSEDGEHEVVQGTRVIPKCSIIARSALFCHSDSDGHPGETREEFLNRIRRN